MRIRGEESRKAEKREKNMEHGEGVEEGEWDGKK